MVMIGVDFKPQKAEIFAKKLILFTCNKYNK